MEEVVGFIDTALAQLRGVAGLVHGNGAASEAPICECYVCVASLQNCRILGGA